MLEFSTEWLFQILRIGVVLPVAVLVTIVLLRVTKASPTTRILAWIMVLLPGCLLFSFSLEVPWYELKVPQSPEPVLSIAFLHNLDNELNVPPTNPVDAGSDSQSAGTGHLIFLALVSVWATGMIVIAGRNVYSFLRLSSAVKALPPPANSTWLGEFDMAFEASELQRKPYFKVSNNIGPLVCRSNGNFAVVIPDSFWSECSSEKRIAVLQHEFAHIERGDMWTLLLGEFLHCLSGSTHWFGSHSGVSMKRSKWLAMITCFAHHLKNKSSMHVRFLH